MSEDDILSDKPELAPVAPKAWEPWNCTACGVYVYNVDKLGRPIAGAPCPRYISKLHPIVCSACWSMYVILDRSEYFTKIQKEDVVSEEERARRLRKLRPGSDYLS